LIEKFKGEGEAIFTQPQGIIKCAGGEYFSASGQNNGGARLTGTAPQKIAYMADAYWKSANTPVQSRFVTGMPSMFSVPHYAKALNAIREEKGIAGEFNTNLVEVRPDDKIAVFEFTAGDRKGERIEKEFGLLHVVPPMGPLDSVKSSPLADAAGWVNVDQGTLQHQKYENVFSLGDASSLPTSKVSLISMAVMSQVGWTERYRLPQLSPDKHLS
jgi:sulfide:quinone oxidoreductase